MTNDEIRIVIAEKCGMKCPHCQNTGVKEEPSFSDPSTLVESPCRHQYLPNYPNDLNAMHEAEKTIPVGELKNYYNNLTYICCGNHVFMSCPYGWLPNYHMLGENLSTVVHATARQRAEAFIKTVCPEKWKNE